MNKNLFKSVQLFLMLPVLTFLVSCGEVVGTKDYSTVITSEIGWKKVVDINSLNISNFPLNGTCTPQAGIVTVRVGAPMIATKDVDCVRGKFADYIDLSSAGVPQGMTELMATQSMLPAQAQTNLWVDTVLPLMPVIISPANGATVVTRNITVDGTCEPNSIVNIFGDLSTANYTTLCLGGNFSGNVRVIVGDGIKNINVSQTDPSGNISPTATVTITLDTSVGAAPLAPVITSPTNSSSTNSVAQNIVGTCESGATLSISGSIALSPVSALCVGGVYNVPVNLTVGDGLKSINVNQTNGVGTSPTTSVSISLDTSNPAAPTITTPVDNSYSNTTSQTIVGTCETGATLNLSGNIIGSPQSSVCIGGVYSEIVTLIAGDGPKTVTAGQTDAAGNPSPNTSITINLDTGIPAAPTITSPANNSYTTSTAQTIVGTCEGNLSLNISGGIVGSPVAGTCVAGSYSQAVTLTAADGAKAISVTQTDLAGNTSPAASITINLDASIPAAPTITSPANNSYTTSTAQTIVGTCEGNLSLSISGNITGSPVAGTCVAGSYSQAVTLTAADGAKAVSVTQTDLAGNTSPAVSITINLDTGIPAAPTITSPADNSYTNLTSQTITGACETGATLNLLGNIVGTPQSSICIGGVYSEVVTLTAGDGPKTVTANQTDAGGNTSPNTSITINLDTGIPAAPTITSPANNSYTNSTAQTIVGTCEGNLSLSISGGIQGSPVAASCVAGSYSQAVTLTVADGAKAISVTQTDLAGNTSPAASITINLDTGIPAAPTITSPANNSYTNSTAQTIIGTCEGNLSLSISGGIQGSPVAASCVAGSYSQAVTLTAADGAKAISVTQTDLAGNTSPAASITINLDTGIPAAPTITSPADNSYTNTTAQTIVGTCETDALVSISGGITGGPVNVICAAGSYSQAVTLTVADGAKAISVTQTDLALNTSPAVSITINLDTGIPAAPTITSPANNSYTNLTAQTIVGTCEGNLSLSISGGIQGSPVAASCVAGSYSQAVTLTAADGAKAISVTQTDLAGNTSPAASITINLDTGIPAAPTITSPANNSYTTITAQTIVGTCEGNLSLSISGGIQGSPVAASCVAGSYSQAVTLTAADGAKAISVTQTDLAGNTSPAASITINLDTQAPSVVISSVSSTPTSTSPIPFVITFDENVTGFISGDITVVNGSVTAFSGGPAVYSIEVTPTAAGNVSVSVAASRAQDLAGNNNTVSNTLVINYQIAYPVNAFVSTWNIPANGTSYTLPLKAGLTYNFTVDWGDGSPVGTITSATDLDRIHTWTNSGTYTVTMTGVLQGYGTSVYGPCYITEVLNLGYMGWTDTSWMFKHCWNLTSVATVDGEEVANVTSFAGMFYEALISNPDVSDWNVSSGNDFSYMFSETNLANPDTSSWLTSSALNFEGMFDNAAAADPDVSGWDVDLVFNFQNMFQNADSATPDVASWTLGPALFAIYMQNMFRDTALANPNVTTWNTSRVVNMADMFHNALSANPNVTNWNVSRVQNFAGMFKGTQVANPQTGLWVTSSMLTAQYMFDYAQAANPNVTNWDTTNLFTAEAMFSNMPIGNPNVVNWVTSGMADMDFMFDGSPLANPVMTTWSFNSIGEARHIFRGTSISRANYSTFLQRAYATTVSTNIDLGYINATYNPASATARSYLLGPLNWTFTDNGP